MASILYSYAKESGSIDAANAILDDLRKRRLISNDDNESLLRIHQCNQCCQIFPTHMMRSNKRRASQIETTCLSCYAVRELKRKSRHKTPIEQIEAGLNVILHQIKFIIFRDIKTLRIFDYVYSIIQEEKCKNQTAHALRDAQSVVNTVLSPSIHKKKDITAPYSYVEHAESPAQHLRASAPQISKAKKSNTPKSSFRRNRVAKKRSGPHKTRG